MQTDIYFINHCIALGKIALERGEAPVGSIWVREGTNKKTMITITYPALSSQVEEWKDRLTNLSVSFQLKEDRKIETVYLEEGNKQVKGNTDINQFLDQLTVDVREWCKCVCD